MKKTCLEKENSWMRNKIKDLEEMLKTEKKEKELLQQVRNEESENRRVKEFEECDRKRRASEAEVRARKRKKLVRNKVTAGKMCIRQKNVGVS